MYIMSVSTSAYHASLVQKKLQEIDFKKHEYNLSENINKVCGTNSW